MRAESGVERAILLDDFEGGVHWSTQVGDQSPFPTGKVELIDSNAHGGKKCGAFTYDVSQDNGYVASNYDRPIPPRTKTFSFWARTDGEVALIVRVQDLTGQTHQRPLAIKPGTWQRVDLSFETPWPTHFNGADDGVFHDGARGIQLLRAAGSRPKTGAVYVDDLAAVTTASADELASHYWKHQQVTIQTAVPGNLFYPGDEPIANLSVNAPPEGLDEISVTGESYGATGQPSGFIEKVLLRRAENFTSQLRLPNALGYYHVKLKLTGGPHEAAAETRYAVIPSNPALNRKDPDSPFGVNTHFNQGYPAAHGPIAKRAGIEWIRDGESGAPDGKHDAAVDVAEANNLNYLACITWWLSPTHQQFKQHLAANGNAPESWDFREAVNWYRTYAETFGGRVDYYDLINEPHGPWSEVLGGNWAGGPWLKAYVQFGRAVSSAIRSADPKATIFWEDCDSLVWYKQLHELGIADELDVLSPHPYNLHRSNPLPENHPMVSGQLAEFKSFVNEKKLDWRIWSGEVGFASYTIGQKNVSAFYPGWTQPQQAQMLVRMMVLQLYGGVEKIFWYQIYDSGWDPEDVEQNFGLITPDNLPKPSIVAYANLIDRLRGTRWLGRVLISGAADAYAFEKVDRPMVVAWRFNDAGNESLQIYSDVKELTITDIYGQSRTIPVEKTATGRRVILPLTESPIYIDGLSRTDLAQAMRPKQP